MTAAAAKMTKTTINRPRKDFAEKMTFANVCYWLPGAEVKAISLQDCVNNSAPVFWVVDTWHLVCVVWTEQEIMENLRDTVFIFIGQYRV
jgi:hypothetical protein